MRWVSGSGGEEAEASCGMRDPPPLPAPYKPVFSPYFPYTVQGSQPSPQISIVKEACGSLGLLRLEQGPLGAQERTQSSRYTLGVVP